MDKACRRRTHSESSIGVHRRRPRPGVRGPLANRSRIVRFLSFRSFRARTSRGRVASRRVDIECARTFSDGAGAKRRTSSGGGGLARRRAGATAGGGDRDGGLLGLRAHRVVRAGGSETTTGVTRNEVGVTSTGCFVLFLFRRLRWNARVQSINRVGLVR